MGAAALAMTACSNEDNIVNNDLQQNAEVKTYTVSIPATFGDDAQTRAVEFDNSGTPAIDTKFVENEKVYVYNVTDDELLGGYLEAKNVSADGLSCELKGTLTGTNTLVPDDKILLMYNLTVAVTESSSRHMTRFDYGYQQGTAATVIDGATSTMMVKDIDTSDGNKLTFYVEGDGSKTQAKASFTNVQSMFRFRFSDGNDIINVQLLKITSKKNALVQAYYPLHGTSMGLYGYGALTVNLTSATTDYIYLGLCFDPSKTAGDVLEFQVTDDKGAVYSGSKAAPAAGFSPLKYYYSTTAIVLTKHMPPTITYTSSGNAVTNMNALTDGFDITMTNPTGVPNCIGSYYNLGAGGTLRLNNLTATNNDPSPFFNIASNDDNLTLDITGTNTITCEQTTYCFSTNSGNLKLSGNGTLTVRSKTEYGLHGANYAYDGGAGGYDVDQLPATGYTVTRSTPTDNGDGTYTCTYTVTTMASTKTLASVTTSEIGWRIGSDGKAYSPTGILPTGVDACAIIAYVGSETGKSAPYNHGLAIAMKDANDAKSTMWMQPYSAVNPNQYTVIANALAAKESGWSLSSGRNNDTYPAFKAALANSIAAETGISAAAPATVTSGWFMPSIFQWNQIVNGLTGTTAAFTTTQNDNLNYSAVNPKIEAAGGVGLKSTSFYWSSTEYDSDIVWCYNATRGCVNSETTSGKKTLYNFVRAAFAF